MNTQAIYERITGIVIEMLENHKNNNYSESWINLSGGSTFAKNAVSNHVYSGINQLLLSYLKRKYNYTHNSWMTFKQLSELGGRIQKGSKASMVVFKSVLYIDKKTEKNITPLIEGLIAKGQSTDHIEFKKVGYLKSYLVFSVSQIDGLPEQFYKLADLEQMTGFERDEYAEHIIESTGANICYAPQNEAYYMPSEDKIYMPDRRQFDSTEKFLNVIWHEVLHWTSHPSRLNRPIANKIGDKGYSVEEITAELGSAFLCAYLGYENRITNNVAYIENWLSVMKNDKQFVVQASSQAQKAADYILEFSQVTEDAPF